MENKFWQYWNLQTEATGRQRWIFTPPAGITDWNTKEAEQFLDEMQKSFVFNKTTNPNSADKVYRNSKTTTTNPSVAQSVEEGCAKAFSFYSQLQSEHGFFPGDYGGPHFLLPGLVIAAHVTQAPLPHPHCALIRQYMLNHQNSDGGWGLHLESSSTMFGTVLQYVALRLLGVSADEKVLQQAHEWILANGSATCIPSWGKFYLSVLGVYEWHGCHSLFPEMWLLPTWLPFHPVNYWCHARMVYLPMAYCFGEKVKGEVSPLISSIRNELYQVPYDSIDWIKARNLCALPDLYHRASPLLNLLNACTNNYEKTTVPFFRKKAINLILDKINAEDEHTNYINIGPVNQVINSIVVWHAYGKESKQFMQHYERWFDYLWIAEDGMKMNGYNGSQLWDTCFAAQAAIEFSEAANNPDSRKIVSEAYNFIEQSQISEEVRECKKYFRHASVGGWPFSTVEHGWPITDCSAEGLKTAIQIHHTDFAIEPKITAERLKQAADRVLGFQNANGGWASYELTRGGKWIELLNPSEIFGNIMIDYPYTECTSACVQGLAKFNSAYPDYKKQEIERAIKKGRDFILKQQRVDGSWYGSWAVCFTYGTWFAIEALITNEGDFNEADKAVSKACAFLISKQNDDGSWGEKFDACLTKQYENNESGQVTNTAWAVLALMKAGNSKTDAVKRGIEFLLSQQTKNGDFPQQSISGVFNHSCGITYTAYRNVFPAWALARYLKFQK